MAVGGACTPVVDALLKLEPLLSNAIVFNLAFLALPKFAYIEETRRLVHDRIAELDKDLQLSIQETPWFTQAKALSQVVTAKRVGHAKGPAWLDLPGWWGKIFNVMFYWPVGRMVSYATTAVSILFLTIAVADNDGIWSLGECGWPQQTLAIDFWLSLFALMWPILCVMAGNHVTRSVTSWMSYQTNNLARAKTEEAAETIETFVEQAGIAPSK